MDTTMMLDNKSVTRQRLFITLSYWAATIADGAARIIIPLYLVSIGVSATSIGIAFLFYELFGLVTNVYSGFFINRFGYKRAFTVALVLHTIASLGYLLLFPEMGVWLTLILINIFRAFRGMGKELMKTACSAYFKNLKDEGAKRGKMPIQILLGGKDGFKGLGLLIGGGLLALVGFKLSFVILGVVTLLFLLLAYRSIDDYREKKKVDYTGFFKVKRKMVWLAWSRAFLYASRDIWLIIPMPLYLSSLGYSEVDIAGILAIGLVFFGLAQPFAASQMKTRWTLAGRTLKPALRYCSVVVWGPLFLVLVPATMLLSPQHVISILLAVMLFNLLAGIATMPHNHLHLKYAKGKRASVDIAFYKTVAQLGKVIAMPVSGVLYSIYGIQGCLVASIVALFLAAFCALFIDREVTATDDVCIV